MTFQQELQSWLSPTALETSPIPVPGTRAPSTEALSFPLQEKKPAVVTFLRHCGCPFAEKIFRALRKAAAANPDVDFIAVSHSNQQSTDEWVSALGGTSEHGSSRGVRVVVDDTRKSHAKWGLGISSVWHVLSPGGMRNLFKLGREEGIWNRPTSSGSRWQTAGSFGVDAEGVVRWSRAAGRADEMPDFEEGVRMVSKAGGTKSKL